MLFSVFIVFILSFATAEVVNLGENPTILSIPSTPAYNQVNPNFTYPESVIVNLSQAGIPYQGEIRSGYITVNPTTQSKIFYTIYPAGGSKNSQATINNTAPIILWLEGGPGCSDGIGNYGEIGPFTIKNQSGTFVPLLRDITWNDEYNLLFVDSPAGVGYSVSGNETYTSAYSVSQYLQVFLIRFFQVYPTLAQNDFYIFGESYGGKYVPALATIIVQNVTQNGINLKGLGVGNGCTNVYYQQASQSDLAFSLGLLDELNRNKLAAIEMQAQQLIQSGNLTGGSSLVDELGDIIGQLNFQVNQYNFEQYPPIYFPTEYEQWLNLENVKLAYGADPNVTFVDCVSCHSDFLADEVVNYAINYTYLLTQDIIPDLKILLYGGQNDMICNNLGVQNYLKNLEWSEISGFINSQKKILIDSYNNVLGNYKHYERLTFAIVYDAGHMAGGDQPATVRLLLKQFMDNSFK